MRLSEFKSQLERVKHLQFVLPNGKPVPEHFHVTEIGQVHKQFIDCGGTVRHETTVNFQFWEANDVDHRLAPQKLKSIIALSETKLGLQDAEIEVEYQSDTIGKYGIGFNGTNFELLVKQTNCRASDKCGLPPEKLKVSLRDLTPQAQNCCTPGGSCC